MCYDNFMLPYALVGRFGACMVSKNLKQIVLYRYTAEKKSLLIYCENKISIACSEKKKLMHLSHDVKQK